MHQHPFQELRLRDFRCFHEEQTARLAPLTLLVGDNSTGKTSFLAGVRAVWNTAFQQVEPDFREPPYDLGAFPEIVHNRSDGESGSSFDLGFRCQDPQSTPIEFDVTFASRAAAPSPSRLSWCTTDTRVECSGVDTPTVAIELASDNGTWRCEVKSFRRRWLSAQFLVRWLRNQIYELDDAIVTWRQLTGPRRTPGRRELQRFGRLLHRFAKFSSWEPPFASAPIRSSPSRTYDPTRPLPDPAGAYVPTYFANVHYRDKHGWRELRGRLEDFGRRSGLFDEVAVKQLGDVEGGPFQLQVRKAGARSAGRTRNLIDVGYGVSQTLPVLVELFRPDAPQVLLFQQPEVHLHPSAQAALGSLFCETAAAGRQLVVETHSDYIVDRALLDVRDKRTALRAEDVSILFFQREDIDVRIHSIRIDDEGNVLDAPEGYRRFFQDELNRVIDY